MVTSLASRLKFSLGYFSTATATADQLFLLLWNAIGLLESYAGLKVVVVVSDKAGPNQHLYNLHASGDEVTCRTKNVFASDEERYIYFFSDPPQLGQFWVRNKEKKFVEQWQAIDLEACGRSLWNG